MTEHTTDVLIVGAGSGGYSCALRAAQLGLRVTLVEKGEVGGTCLHSGCIPTKALLHAAEVADSIRNAGAIGLRASIDEVDAQGIRAYQQSVIGRLHQGLAGLLKSRKIEVVPGHGRLVGDRTVEVGSQRWIGKALVLATGSRTNTIPGVDIDGLQVLGSEHALTLDALPGSAVVLGGGVIGCEFASAWRGLDSEVTIVEALPRLLPGEDEDSSKALERSFRKRGISVHTSTRVKGIDAGSGYVRVRTDGDTFEAEKILVAVGRVPNTADLGLPEHNVQLDERGFVVVDDRLRTMADGTYAVGDIVNGPQLAHRGFAHGLFVAEQIAGLSPVPTDDEQVPRITYSDPQVASVGLTEAEARSRFGGDAVTTVRYELSGNGKSQILQTQGFVKLVQQRGGAVVGIHVVGAGAGELIGEAQLAVAWEALPDDVAALVHAHPTQHEALGEAFLALAGKPLHGHS